MRPFVSDRGLVARARGPGFGGGAPLEFSKTSCRCKEGSSNHRHGRAPSSRGREANELVADDAPPGAEESDSFALPAASGAAEREGVPVDLETRKALQEYVSRRLQSA